MRSWQVSTAMHLYPELDRDLRSRQGSMLTCSLGHFGEDNSGGSSSSSSYHGFWTHQMALIFPFNMDSSLPSGSVYAGIRLHRLKVSVAERCCFALNRVWTPTNDGLYVALQIATCTPAQGKEDILFICFKVWRWPPTVAGQKRRGMEAARSGLGLVPVC